MVDWFFFFLGRMSASETKKSLFFWKIKPHHLKWWNKENLEYDTDGTGVSEHPYFRFVLVYRGLVEESRDGNFYTRKLLMNSVPSKLEILFVAPKNRRYSTRSYEEHVVSDLYVSCIGICALSSWMTNNKWCRCSMDWRGT